MRTYARVGEALWTLFVIVLPLLGCFVFLIVHGSEVNDRVTEAARADTADMPTYIYNKADLSGIHTTDESRPARRVVLRRDHRVNVPMDHRSSVPPPMSCAWSSPPPSSSSSSAVEWLFGDALRGLHVRPPPRRRRRAGVDRRRRRRRDADPRSDRSSGDSLVDAPRTTVANVRHGCRRGLGGRRLVTVLDALIETDPGRVLVDVGVDLRPLTNTDFPSTAGIAAIVGVLTAAAPWLGRRWRRAGWALIAGLMVTGFVDSPVSFDLILAPAVGWLSGAAVLVAAGAPTRRPALRAVVDGLCTVGLPVQRLEQASVDARGSTPYLGVGADGSKLFVKALGADERSADLLFRLYRQLQPRNFGDERPFDTLRRAVEHEAFVALVARSLGVRTPSVRAFATVEPNGYVLAYDAIDGRSLDRVEPSEVTDEVLAATWFLVGELRRHRIRASRPPPGERLPRRQRPCLADRLRLQRSGRLGSATGDRRRRTARLMPACASAPSGRRPARRAWSSRQRWRRRSIVSIRGRSAARPERR